VQYAITYFVTQCTPGFLQNLSNAGAWPGCEIYGTHFAQPTAEIY
jgi:hypothetical protein